MFLELPSNNHMDFVQVIGLIGCHCNRKAQFSSKPLLSVVIHGPLFFNM